jgi:hypothetical protein
MRIHGTLEPDQRTRRHGGERRGFRCKGGRRRPTLALLLGEQDANGLARRITWGVAPRIHLRQQGLVDPRERRSDRNRDERLLPHGLAARFDPALIVALAGPTETRLQQVVRGERSEARRQRARAADEDPHDRRAQIVILMCPRTICGGARARERSALVDRGKPDT